MKLKIPTNKPLFKIAVLDHNTELIEHDGTDDLGLKDLFISSHCVVCGKANPDMMKPIETDPDRWGGYSFLLCPAHLHCWELAGKKRMDSFLAKAIRKNF